MIKTELFSDERARQRDFIHDHEGHTLIATYTRGLLCHTCGVAEYEEAASVKLG